MKKKIVGILVCMLFIATVVFPASGTIKTSKTTLVKDSIPEKSKIGQDRITESIERNIFPSILNPLGILPDLDWNYLTNIPHMYALPAGNVGIGTWDPKEKLDVVGTVQMTGFKMPTCSCPGYVLTSDENGVGTWQAARGDGGDDGDWTISGDNMYSTVSGNVSIGTTVPGNNKLCVYRPNGEYGAGRSAIYGYRHGASGAANGGTSWHVDNVDAAVKGYSYYGNQYTAGVAGYSRLEYDLSAAVIGAKNTSSPRGMLAYQDGSSKEWAGYFVGEACVTDSITIGSSATRFAMEHVSLTASGILFTHPAVQIYLWWDSVSKTLTFTNNENVYYDCGMHGAETADDRKVEGVADDVPSGLSLSLCGNSQKRSENAHSWYVTATNEGSSGPGFIFMGNGYNTKIQGLVIYWY